MIAHVSGTVAAVAPDGAVIEVGGVGLLVQCTPGTLAGLRTGERATGRDLAGGPRGLADPVRVRRRRRAQHLRAAADRQRGRAAAGAGHAGGHQPGRAAPGGGGRGPGRAHLRARHRPQGRAADRARARRAGWARRGLPDGAGGACRCRGVAAWREQVRAGLVNLGWPARDAEQAIAAVEPELAAGADRRRRQVDVCAWPAAPRCGCWAGHDDSVASPASRGRRAGTRAPPDAAPRRPELRRWRAAAQPEPATTWPDRVVSPLADADDRVIEGALRPKRLSEFIGQGRVREQLSLVLEGALRRGRPPDHVLLSGPPGPGQDDHRHDHRRRARRAAADHQRPGDRAGRGPGRGAVHAEPRARCCSSTRSTGWPARPRRCSTWPWRTSGST